MCHSDVGRCSVNSSGVLILWVVSLETAHRECVRDRSSSQGSKHENKCWSHFVISCQPTFRNTSYQRPSQDPPALFPSDHHPLSGTTAKHDETILACTAVRASSASRPKQDRSFAPRLCTPSTPSDFAAQSTTMVDILLIQPPASVQLRSSRTGTKQLGQAASSLSRRNCRILWHFPHPHLWCWC